MLDSGPLVSVIVPVYNSASLLPTCLDSILEQTYESIELLVVDDGSTDGSWDVVCDYGDRDGRVRGFRQANAGPGVARNAMLEIARGDYVLCVDCDDWIDSTLLEKAVGAAEGHQADIVVWDAWFHNVRTGRCCLSSMVRVDVCGQQGYVWTDDPDALFVSFQNWPWNKLVRRSLLEEYGIRFQEIMRTEDLLFTAQALVKARLIVGIPEALSHYRMAQEASAMSTKDLHPRDFFEAFKALKAWLEAEGAYPALEKSFVRWAFTSVLYNLKTLHGWPAYRDAFEFMKRSGLGQLGLAIPGPNPLLDEWQRGELDTMLASSPEEYVLHSLAHEWRVGEDASTLSGARWFELEEEKRARRAVEKRAEEAERALSGLEARLDEERRLRQAVEADREAILDSAEQKVGTLLCRIPRAFQRSFRERKGE